MYLNLARTLAGGTWFAESELAEAPILRALRNTVLTDENGKWPTWYHHIIIQDTFGNLGTHAVQVLNDASDWVDNLEHQAPEFSYMHAMRDGAHNQTVAAAQRLTELYITSEVNAAVEAQIAFEQRGGRGYSDDALTHFGHAVHTVMRMSEWL